MPKSKINSKTVMDEVKIPLLIIGGMYGGTLAGKALDKVLKVDESLAGINMKAVAKPVALLSAGIAGSIFLKDKNLKLIASGVAASGIASGVKVFLKKDLLAGFDGLGSDYLQVESYDPELPMLPEGDYHAMDIEMAGPDNRLEDYEEIEEVEIL
jgi:hypothetical protein